MNLRPPTPTCSVPLCPAPLHARRTTIRQFNQALLHRTDRAHKGLSVYEWARSQPTNPVPLPLQGCGVYTRRPSTRLGSRVGTHPALTRHGSPDVPGAEQGLRGPKDTVPTALPGRTRTTWLPHQIPSPRTRLFSLPLSVLVVLPVVLLSRTPPSAYPPHRAPVTRFRPRQSPGPYLRGTPVSNLRSHGLCATGHTRWRSVEVVETSLLGQSETDDQC